MAKPANRKKRINSSAELLDKLRSNKNFQYSPVFYLADLLEDYFEARLTKDELEAAYRRETLRAQFVYSKMPASEIRNNKHIFREEFAFADALTAVITSAGATKESDFYQALRGCVENYLFK